MNCVKVARYLNAYADGELDVTVNLEVAAHVHACPGCARAVADQRLMRNALGRALRSEPVPMKLLTNIREAVTIESRVVTRQRGPMVRPWLSAAAALVLGLGLPWLAWQHWLSRPGSSALFAADFTRNVVAQHVDVVHTLSNGPMQTLHASQGDVKRLVQKLGVSLEAFAPNLSAVGLELAELSVCQLRGGERGLAAVYRKPASQDYLSLFSIVRRQADVAEASRESLSAARFHVETVDDTEGPVALVGWNSDPSVGVPTSYLACARVPADQLLQLITTVRWELSATPGNAAARPVAGGVIEPGHLFRRNPPQASAPNTQGQTPAAPSAPVPRPVLPAGALLPQ